MANIKGLEPETGNTIGNLSSNIPLKIDPVSQGDDHIRATKRALQASFPAIGTEEVELTATQINNAFNFYQIGMVTHFVVPTGGSVILPEGWYLCDGGTYLGIIVPNCLDKHIKATHALEATRSQGGINSITLEFNNVGLVASQMFPHKHIITATFRQSGDTDGGSGGEYKANWGYDSTQTLVSKGGSSNPDLAGAADPHIHPISSPIRNNQPVHMITLTAIYLGLTGGV